MEKFTIEDSPLLHLSVLYNAELKELRLYISNIIRNSTGNSLYIDLKEYYMKNVNISVLKMQELMCIIRMELREIGWNTIEYNGYRRIVKKKFMGRETVVEKYPYMMITIL